jgi:hypothetical protein
VKRSHEADGSLGGDSCFASLSRLDEGHSSVRRRSIGSKRLAALGLEAIAKNRKAKAKTKYTPIVVSAEFSLII